MDALFLKEQARDDDDGSAAATAPGSTAFAFAANSRRLMGRRAPPEQHLHAAFTSVGLQATGELDELSFSDWLEGVLQRHGGRLFRAKGVLFFEGVDEPTSLHCVGGHAECERLRMAPSDIAPSVSAGRISRLVFIGRTRGIEKELIDGFRALQVAGR